MKIHRFAAVSVAILGAAAMSMPAQAQFGGFGGIVNDARRAAERDSRQDDDDAQQTPEECAADSSPSVGREVLGGLLGRAGRDAARRAGIPLFVPVTEFTDQLTTAIACKLNPDEQRQMADATLEATRSDTDDGEAEIGSTSAWVSETRPGVSGRSTVTGRENASADGMECILVADIIIVEGEETRADKRMCRRPPSRRYARTA